MNMREEFEKWYQVQDGAPDVKELRDIFKLDEDGEYYFLGTHLGWQAWQAAWQAAQPKWIKCSDQMPPENVIVTIADAGYGQLYACAVASMSNGEFYPVQGLTASNYDGGAIVDIDMEVTHWMTLPNPPEE
ncbi:DUF551 domain-containing protein [Edwardsiella tarda]|uniref:DUF551 domain-containing protein n=1 Tax=Edwardsiella tarda TaxID=636 RepID=UPI0030814AA4|nr:hypothetical protein GBS0709_24590 [Edwardsiella tarda]